MKPAKWAIAFAMLVLGFLITTQYRVTQLSAPKMDLRSEELARELKAAQEKLKAAERDNTRLKAEVEKLTKAGGGNVVAVPQRDPNLELLAGSVGAKGPGVIATFAQATDVVNKTAIKDEDLWMIVHELLSAGAEGISINGQRVTSLTAIRGVGQRIMINSTYTAGPYQIAAIGDPTVLEAAMRMKGGLIDYFKQPRINLRLDVVRSTAVELPSYGSIPDFRFAKPVK
ncbi:MAG TPA: DUF881 domain-containing protein [Symbiobacteriaceae bacterium]|nr:DUF881 domain-containing protein [Symbiobacteriaceae bacterium]